MRADRLIGILMLLQRHGRMTASDLADNLAVSERTIYRDCDALAETGVPIFAQPGPGGGIALMESFRTDLTGLTNSEAQALFALQIPTPIVNLGVGDDLQAAFRKLQASVPNFRWRNYSAVAERFLIDDSAWGSTDCDQPVFAAIRQALWEERQLEISYYSEIGIQAGTISTTVAPFGLVAAAEAWYLVAGRDEHIIVIPLNRLLEAQVCQQTFARPVDFRLADYWQSWTARTRRRQPSFIVKARIAATLRPHIEGYIREEIGSAVAACFAYLVILEFTTFESARARILGWGSAIEVVHPEALRLSVADFARQTLLVYDTSQA